MSLLLDAHVLLWLFLDPARLPQPIVDAIRDEARAKWVSAATVWEIEIKRTAGKLRVPADLAGRAWTSGFLELPIRAVHAASAASLPPHHADPFDRMLVAQALVEGMTLVTADPQIARYAAPVLAV